MSTRREGLERMKDRQGRKQLRAARVREADLLDKLKASLGVDPRGECKALVIRIAL